MTDILCQIRIGPPGRAGTRPDIRAGEAVAVFADFLDESGVLLPGVEGAYIQAVAPDGTATTWTGGQLGTPAPGTVRRQVLFSMPGTWVLRAGASAPTATVAETVVPIGGSAAAAPGPVTQSVEQAIGAASAASLAAAQGLAAAEAAGAVASAVTDLVAGGRDLLDETEAPLTDEDGAPLRTGDLSDVEQVARGAAVRTSLADLASGEMLPGMPRALVVRDDGAMVPYRRVPAAPATPITGIHVQRTDGSWWEAAIGPDAKLADINASIGVRAGTTPPPEQNDGPALDALLRHVYDRYGAADVALPPRVLQVRSKFQMPVRSTIRGSIRPGFDGYDNAALKERLTAAPLLLIDPAIGGIEASHNAAFMDLNLLRMGHVYSTDWPSLLAITPAFAGVGIDLVRTGVPNRARNFLMERVGIYGFATGVDGSAANRSIFRDCRADCRDSFRLLGAGDGLLFENIRQFSWLNATEGNSVDVVTVGITELVDVGGKLGAVLDKPADGLETGARVGSDKAPLDGFGRCTLTVITPTLVVFRDIPWSATYELDPDADISYRKNSSSVIASVSNAGGLTRLSTEAAFPFLMAGQTPYTRIGIPTGHPLEARQTIVTAESPTDFVVDLPWDPAFAALDLQNSDFQLLPGYRGGTTIYATGVDGLVINKFFSKGNDAAAYLDGGNMNIVGGGGSEGAVTGEESFVAPGTVGVEIARVGRMFMAGYYWKTTDVGMRFSGGTPEALVTGCQLSGNRWALEVLRGRLSLQGCFSQSKPEHRRIRVAAAVRRLRLGPGQFRRTDCVIEGDHRRVFDPYEEVSETGAQRPAFPGWSMSTITAAGVRSERIAVPASGPVTIDGVSLPLVLRATAGDATPVRLTTDGTAPTSANVGPLVANADGQRVRTLRIVVTAERLDGGGGAEGDGATWERTVTLSRRFGVTSTEVAPIITAVEPGAFRGGGSAYRLTITADTDLGAVQVLGIGASATNVRFTAQIQVIG